MLRAAALSHRHGRDLLRTPRQAGARSRAPATCSSRSRPRSCGSTRSRPASTPRPRRANRAASSAFFLTWMQEKTRGLFVGATANRIDLLPAEMIRKGRFDEVFFVDLPLDEERIEIVRVHLRRRGIDPSAFNLEPMKKFTRGWTGAELEQCVVSALTTARLEDRELTGDGSAERHRPRRAAVEDDEGAGRAHPQLGVRPRGARLAARRRALAPLAHVTSARRTGARRPRRSRRSGPAGRAARTSRRWRPA